MMDGYARYSCELTCPFLNELNLMCPMYSSDYNCNADLGPGYRTIYPGVLELTNGYNDVFNSFVCSPS